MYKIYTKDLCGYCTMAKQIFDNKELEYEEIHVDGNAQALAHLRLNNLRTVPQIYDPNSTYNKNGTVKDWVDNSISVLRKEPPPYTSKWFKNK